MANIFHVDRKDNTITLGLSDTVTTVPVLTVSRLLASNASKALVSTALVDWVTGTANRVTVSADDDPAGGIVLTGPQDIHTGASPTFVGLNLVEDGATILFNWTTTSSYGEIWFKEGETTIGNVGGFGTAYGADVGGDMVIGARNKDLLLRTFRDADWHTRITVSNNGNIGINVIDPHSKLEVNGAISSATLIVTTGAYDDLDVSGVNTVFLDCSGGAITIGGLVGGVNGQVLHIARLCASADAITLEHLEGAGNQDIYLHAGADEALSTEYGGWILVCNGTSWFDTSHAKHV